MSEETGLPLFDWRPSAGGVVLAFPIERQVRRIRETAAGLHSRRGEAAAAFWRDIVGAIEVEMIAAGFGEDVQLQALWNFHESVQAELRKIAGWDRQGPSAA